MACGVFVWSFEILRRGNQGHCAWVWGSCRASRSLHATARRPPVARAAAAAAAAAAARAGEWAGWARPAAGARAARAGRAARARPAGAAGAAGAAGLACADHGRVDLLLAIDNSRSMADKQRILALSVPDLVQAFTNPPCLSGFRPASFRPCSRRTPRRFVRPGSRVRLRRSPTSISASSARASAATAPTRAWSRWTQRVLAEPEYDDERRGAPALAARPVRRRRRADLCEQGFSRLGSGSGAGAARRDGPR